ncbi:unnamed protein product [Victoria cruziana]
MNVCRRYLDRFLTFNRLESQGH